MKKSKKFNLVTKYLIFPYSPNFPYFENFLTNSLLFFSFYMGVNDKLRLFTTWPKNQWVFYFFFNTCVFETKRFYFIFIKVLIHGCQKHYTLKIEKSVPSSLER